VGLSSDVETRILAVMMSVLVLVAGCADTSKVRLPVVPPPANGGFDYQLGGGYVPADDVVVLSRDRTDEPDPDRYNICYVNGFQTQPDEADLWLGEHPGLLLRDANGSPFVDPEFPDEYILDTTSADSRRQLTRIVGAWIDGCAAAGFQAVEIDNLDTFSRFSDELDEDAAVEYVRSLADRAHAAGLAIGQKNSAELLGRRSETRLDFAVVEQCNEFDECGEFTDVYGGHVYVIEYDQSAFETGCTEFPTLSIVLRDVEVSTPGSPTYLREAC
jgi:hypothetical protein